MSRYIYQDTVQDGFGNALSGASVTVTLAGTSTLATIYSAVSGGSAVSGSVVQTDSAGKYLFYIDDSDYTSVQRFKVTISKTGFTDQEFDYIGIIPHVPAVSFYEYFPENSESDQGAASGSGDQTVKDFIDSLAGDPGTLVFLHTGAASTTVYTFSTSETIPSNITLKIQQGAVLTDDASNADLTIEGHIDAQMYQIFDWGNGSGSVTFGTDAVDKVWCEWWGAATGASAAVNSAAIQAGIDSLAARIRIGQGTFSYSTGLTCDRTIRFHGASSSERNTGTGDTMTRLSYTGSGIALTLDGESVTGTYNMHFGDFSLLGTASADCGIKIGTTVTTPVAMSSLKNINVDLFNKVGACGVRVVRVQQTILENVHCHQNYDGFEFNGSNTTLTVRNCHAISSDRYGFRIIGLSGSSFYQCLAESNADSGLVLYSSSTNHLSFYQWHSESNNTESGDAPNIITGASNAPYAITFFGGYFGDEVSNKTWDLDYANQITWYSPSITTYVSGWMEATANTSDCKFYNTNQSLDPGLITGNDFNRVLVNDGVYRREDSIAASGSINHAVSGIMEIIDTTTGKAGIIYLPPSAATTILVNDGGHFGATAAASNVNVYWDGGGSVFRVQNSTGGTLVIMTRITNARTI